MSGPDIVNIEGGQISGVVDRAVRIFKGIPYAAPPVGALRWKPPQPVVAWPGVRDGSHFGAECPQTPYAQTSVYARPPQRQNEDCLFVNVWTPAFADAVARDPLPAARIHGAHALASDHRPLTADLPVLVWIHGGALTRGSGISDVRDGVPLASKGIVLVTFNYRLGPLGYLAHPELSAESPHGSSGNYGLLDQIAALKWVQDNIAVFGGDPQRVTIAGESAGSWSVNALLASPLAKGLFIRAIGQSGGRFSRTPRLTADRGSQQAAEKVGLAFAKSLAADSLHALRAMPAETLVAVENFRTQETVDGWVLPDEIRTIFAEKNHHTVPVIVGSTADEMTPFLDIVPTPKTFVEFRERLARQYGELAADFETAYGVTCEADVLRATLDAARDTTFSSHMRQWARMTVSAGEKAYLYFFSYSPPDPRTRELKAFHAGEIPYVFNVVPSSDPRERGYAYRDVDRQLAEAMSEYWVNFVRSGDPNGPGLPHWEPYNCESEPYLEFGSTIKSGRHLLKAQLDFLERALKRRDP